MHDVFGSTGMLRGWIDIWTGHYLLLLATMTTSVGAAALIELLFDLRSSRQEYQIAVRPAQRSTDRITL